jgi:hypothetical protein
MTNEVSKLKKRLLQGTKAKFLDGVWSADDLPLPERLLVTGYTRGLQCWQGGELLDELDERDGDLPDVDELNSQIPETEWETGLDGKPRPPWALVHVVYLVDVDMAETYTFISATYGARIAYERLVDRLELTQRLRNANVTAFVKPDRRQMKTKFGMKQRPEFTILEWREIGDGKSPQPAQLPPPTNGPTAAAAETPPWQDPPVDEPRTTTIGKPVAKEVGKPVKPISRQEEFNDSLEDIYRDFPA